MLLIVFGSLRSAVRRVVWSRRQPFANVGAVLSLLDGPTGCDPAFCVVWFRSVPVTSQVSCSLACQGWKDLSSFGVGR